MKNIGKNWQNLWEKTFDGVCSIGKDSNLQLAAFLNEEDLPPSCGFGNIFLNIYSVKDLPLVVHLGKGQCSSFIIVNFKTKCCWSVPCFHNLTYLSST